jgi:hypothetical protein
MKSFSKGSVKIQFAGFPLISKSQTECSNTEYTVWRFFVKVKIQLFDLISLPYLSNISSIMPNPKKTILELLSHEILFLAT